MQHMAVIKAYSIPVELEPQFAALGTPIAWLVENGYTSDFDAAELLDSDQDGQLAWEEYLANTDPNDSTSVFAIEDIFQNPDDSFSIQFETRPNRVYTIEFNSLLTGTWQVFNSNTLGQHISGSTPSSHTFIDDFTINTTGSQPVANRRFYRLAVSLPE